MNPPNQIVLETNFPTLKLYKRGKVRDIYEVGEELLIVATDRLSAFDVVFPDGIPEKGKILNRISAFWFNYLKNLIENHVITTDIASMPAKLRSYREILDGRSMLVRRSKPLPIEAVVRGYLAGSGLKEYRQKGSISGIKLPEGLTESSKLPEPIFTPSTKADVGHDENITEQQAKVLVGEDLFIKVKNLSIAIYNKIAEYAFKRGIIFADTKLEFGLINNDIILIDEVGTPDSSRFWSIDTYEPGQPQASFDKQFVRDYLENIGWNKQPPAPNLPSEIIDGTTQRYLKVFEILTG